jgi:hypothetical protein
MKIAQAGSEDGAALHATVQHLFGGMGSYHVAVWSYASCMGKNHKKRGTAHHRTPKHTHIKRKSHTHAAACVQSLFVVVRIFDKDGDTGRHDDGCHSDNDSAHQAYVVREKLFPQFHDIAPPATRYSIWMQPSYPCPP